MNALVRLSPRAFVVPWSDVERWSVGSFVDTDWRWSPNVVRPLSTALARKLQRVPGGVNWDFQNGPEERV